MFRGPSSSDHHCLDYPVCRRCERADTSRASLRRGGSLREPRVSEGNRSPTAIFALLNQRETVLPRILDRRYALSLSTRQLQRKCHGHSFSSLRSPTRRGAARPRRHGSWRRVLGMFLLWGGILFSLHFLPVVNM